jgi:hypothetical protein
MAINKRKIHHALAGLRHIKTWHLLVALVLLGGLSVFLLRQNNLGMVELRNLVKQADEQNGNIEQALTDLQSYVSSHMNTDLGQGLFLEHAYQRAYDAEIQTAASVVNPNSQAYQQVETKCRQQYVANGSFSGYIACVENGLKGLSPGSDPLASVKVPPQDLFRYNFASPSFSFDWAGLAVLATLLVVALLILRMVGFVTLKILLRVKSHS